MSAIKQISGTISQVHDLSPTAREYTIVPSEPLSFIAGAFVNVFIDHDGKTIRRAFSMSSDDTDTSSFTLSIRLSPKGELTPILWNEDYTGRTVKIMGPLGLNTADKMKREKVFLFGFGVGAGVVKSLAEHIANQNHVTSLTVMTGNRTVDEILHKDYFDDLVQKNKKVLVTYVVTDENQTSYPKGFIQDHVSTFDFNNADVYMCGQGVACKGLEDVIKKLDPQNCSFFIEDFH